MIRLVEIQEKRTLDCAVGTKVGDSAEYSLLSSLGRSLLFF